MFLKWLLLRILGLPITNLVRGPVGGGHDAESSMSVVGFASV